MRDVSAQTRGQVNWIKKYLYEQFRKGSNPPDTILEWQRAWLRDKAYPEVYYFVHTASIEVAEESKGRIQFRHNLIQDIWRFHEGMDDYLMLFYGDQQRVAGQLRTQNRDYGYGKVLIPRIEDEVMIIKTPILNVGKMKSSELKQKYNPSKK